MIFSGLGLQLLQTLPELAQTALQTPVVNVVAGIEDKAVGKGVVLLKGQLDGLMRMFAVRKSVKR